MDVKAIIVEELDEGGFLRTFRMERASGKPLVVSFAEDYDEPSDGPFHFLDERYAEAFREGFATCLARRLGTSRFVRKDKLYRFETSWRGIPTQRGRLTYYALLLPENAIPDTVELLDPHSGRQYRKTVTRNDRKARFFVYLKCRSSKGVFDFILRTSFSIDPQKFRAAIYNDGFIDRHGHNYDLYEPLLERVQRNGVRQVLAGKLEDSPSELDEVLEIVQQSQLADESNRQSVSTSAELYRQCKYADSLKVLYPSIEAIVNAMVTRGGRRPDEFRGLVEKVRWLENQRHIPSDVSNAIEVFTSRNRVLHGNFAPPDDLGCPLCILAFRYLKRLLVEYRHRPAPSGSGGTT